MGLASIGLMAAGAASSTVGSYFSADAQKTSLNYQADILEMNAQSELRRGERQQQSIMLKAAQLKSAQKVGIAGSGVDLSSKSATRVLASTDVMKEIDVNTAAANAISSAWGHRSASMIKRATAGSISPMGSAFSTLLSSGAQVASSWYRMNSAGVFDGDSAQSLPDGMYGSSRDAELVRMRALADDDPYGNSSDPMLAFFKSRGL